MRSNIITIENEDPLRKENHSLVLSYNNPYIHAATSPNTRRAYQADIRHFVR